ncbi:hypothetical protein Poli38472_004200 [Pythium oligandrum]|uniref:Uncharacterized protein n=1 Tax=Pythium oligandrum TaxID=41045 RepID=A0A8K1FJU7_PYTOL|nr:hypothetical protein Poli38472_004200 [Pythium oligandrum]|eukprot:TMW66435.1 hypothetical protein Poli38472_004200 [Pythium oligandrum]
MDRSTSSRVDAGISSLQLLQTRSVLAPWIHQLTEAGPLPPVLDHGPIQFLRQVMELTTSANASAKLMDDALILLTYGGSYLQDQYDPTRCRSGLKERARVRLERRLVHATRARSIQRTMRTQRFHTNQLPALQLDTHKFLLDEIQQRKTMDRPDSLENLVNVPMEVNEPELQVQIEKYAAELRQRMATRRSDEDELRRKQLKEQQVQEDRKKRQVYQKKKCFERAARRWHYFATRLLRSAREKEQQENPQGVSPAARRSEHKLSSVSDSPTARKSTAKHSSQAESPLSSKSVHRDFIRRFVAKAITRGLSRVLCAFNMTIDPSSVRLSVIANGLDALTETQTATSDARKVRLGLLLCDLHFGPKYTGLYQRFFDRVATEKGLAVEWRVFNCLKSQFPTRAQQRFLNGFLVAGGPATSVVQTEQKNRHFGRWRRRLIMLLRMLYEEKRSILGGLGLGHVILAEALGAKIGMNEWEDGWNLLDPSIFDDPGGSGGALDIRLGIRYLHGEFVQTMGTAAKTVRAWKSAREGGFITCFRDKLTLSIDGSPECGAFVFETMSEFYERERHTRQAGRDDEGIVEDTGQDAPLRLESVLTLEAKKKKLGLTDASTLVAHLFLDHFHRRIISTPSSSHHEAGSLMAITGALTSNPQTRDIAASIDMLRNNSSVSAVYMTAHTTSDGHLVVLRPRLEAVLFEHDRSAASSSESPRRKSVHAGTPLVEPPKGMTLTDLRNQMKNLNDEEQDTRAKTPPLCPRVSVRLPSIKSDSSSAFADVVPTGAPRSVLRRGGTVARRIVAPSVGLLTLSETLTLLRKTGRDTRTPGDSSTSIQAPRRKQNVCLRFGDEESRHSQELVSFTRTQLRVLWLRLIAALRIADVSGDQVVILARQSQILDFFRRKRPMWTFVKDCRWSVLPPRQRMKKIELFATCADILVFEHDFLLSNSAKENEAIFHRARMLGLQVYVGRREEIDRQAAKPDRPHANKKALQRRKTGNGVSLTKTLSKAEGTSDGDMQLVEFMLLQLTGVHGVLTTTPEVVLEALENIHTKSDMMQQVDQLFRGWQAKDVIKSSTSNRSGARRVSNGNNASEDNSTTWQEDTEDFIPQDYYDSDDSVTEEEIVTEMARQWAQHSLTPSKPSSPFVPLRPLPSRRGDEVFGNSGTHPIRRPSPTTHHISSSLDRSSGSFRSPVFQRSLSTARHQSLGDSTAQASSEVEYIASAVVGVSVAHSLVRIKSIRQNMTPR